MLDPFLLHCFGEFSNVFSNNVKTKHDFVLDIFFFGIQEEEKKQKEYFF